MMHETLTELWRCLLLDEEITPRGYGGRRAPVSWEEMTGAFLVAYEQSAKVSIG